MRRAAWAWRIPSPVPHHPTSRCPLLTHGNSAKSRSSPPRRTAPPDHWGSVLSQTVSSPPPALPLAQNAPHLSPAGPARNPDIRVSPHSCRESATRNAFIKPRMRGAGIRFLPILAASSRATAPFDVASFGTQTRRLSLRSRTNKASAPVSNKPCSQN